MRTNQMHRSRSKLEFLSLGWQFSHFGWMHLSVLKNSHFLDRDDPHFGQYGPPSLS